MQKDSQLISKQKPLTFSSFTKEDYLKASAIGAARGLVGLSVEHPFDYVKTRMQASGGKSSISEIVSSTYKSHGVGGFYSGAIPNATRVVIKQSYRYPMMVLLPFFYQSNVFKDNNSPILQKALTSLTIASFECFVITPLEKFKIVLMTNKNKSLKTILAESNPIKSSLRDLNIVYPRQIVAWGTYMVPEEFLKKTVKTYQNNDNLSPQALLGISVAVGVLNTAATMPFDAIKTLVQKDKPYPNQGVVKTLSSAYKDYGVKGLYAGWQVRSAQYIVQAYFTSNVIEKLEKNIKQKRALKPN